MLPGDYIAMKLTGSIGMTIEGLSEGIFWDFKEHRISEDVMSFFGFDYSLIPDIVPIFGTQGTVSSEAAAALELKEGTPVGYRAGDQPNNAVSLNVFNPGEIASTAGTSGLYMVFWEKSPGSAFRINIFAHVNHTLRIPVWVFCCD